MHKSATTQSTGLAASTVDIDALVDARVKQALLAAGIKPTGTKAPQSPKFYCWTHGLNHTHHSDTCQHRAEGHVSTATNSSKQGGSTTTWAKPKRQPRDT
jgi:hypothetical protein